MAESGEGGSPAARDGDARPTARGASSPLDEAFMRTILAENRSPTGDQQSSVASVDDGGMLLEPSRGGRNPHFSREGSHMGRRHSQPSENALRRMQHSTRPSAETSPSQESHFASPPSAASHAPNFQGRRSSLNTPVAHTPGSFMSPHFRSPLGREETFGRGGGNDEPPPVRQPLGRGGVLGRRKSFGLSRADLLMATSGTRDAQTAIAGRIREQMGGPAGSMHARRSGNEASGLGEGTRLGNGGISGFALASISRSREGLPSMVSESHAEPYSVSHNTEGEGQLQLAPPASQVHPEVRGMEGFGSLKEEEDESSEDGKEDGKEDVPPARGGVRSTPAHWAEVGTATPPRRQHRIASQGAPPTTIRLMAGSGADAVAARVAHKSAAALSTRLQGRTPKSTIVRNVVVGEDPEGGDSSPDVSSPYRSPVKKTVSVPHPTSDESDSDSDLDDADCCERGMRRFCCKPICTGGERAIRWCAVRLRCHYCCGCIPCCRQRRRTRRGTLGGAVSELSKTYLGACGGWLRCCGRGGGEDDDSGSSSPRRRKSIKTTVSGGSSGDKMWSNVDSNASSMVGSSVFPGGPDVCIVNPRSTFMKYWDALMILLLVFTAVVTPYEVAFLRTQLNGMFLVNRFVDICFLSDLCLNFFVAFVDEEGQWIIELDRIAARYVRTWFWIDLGSILPFDTVGLFLDSSSVSKLAIIRVIRLLRLAKLFRIFRASRIFARWQAHFGFSFSWVKLIRFAVMVVIVAHWSACLFRFVVVLEESTEYNWLTEYEFLGERSNLTEYIAALYFSVVTVTTIGYGDILPVTFAERIVCIVIMFFGASMYAYIIGVIAGVVSNLDQATNHYHQTMDNLNRYMKENNISHDLVVRLRRYFQFSRQLQRMKHYRALLYEMSPSLRREVAVQINRVWALRVPFFSCSDGSETENFITEVALIMEPEAYAPGEEVIQVGDPTEKMFVVQRGVVSRLGRVLFSGAVLGEDMILHEAKRTYTVTTLTYSNLSALNKDDVERVLSTGRFPLIAATIRRHSVRMSFLREFLHYAKLMRVMRQVDPEFSIASDDHLLLLDGAVGVRYPQLREIMTQYRDKLRQSMRQLLTEADEPETTRPTPVAASTEAPSSPPVILPGSSTRGGGAHAPSPYADRKRRRRSTLGRHTRQSLLQVGFSVDEADRILALRQERMRKERYLCSIMGGTIGAHGSTDASLILPPDVAVEVAEEVAELAWQLGVSVGGAAQEAQERLGLRSVFTALSPSEAMPALRVPPFFPSTPSRGPASPSAPTAPGVGQEAHSGDSDPQTGDKREGGGGGKEVEVQNPPRGRRTVSFVEDGEEGQDDRRIVVREAGASALQPVLAAMGGSLQRLEQEMVRVTARVEGVQQVQRSIVMRAFEARNSVGDDVVSRGQTGSAARDRDMREELEGISKFWSMILTIVLLVLVVQFVMITLLLLGKD